MKSIPKITVAVAIGLIVFAAGASTAQTKPAARRPDIYTLWSLTNEERAKAGLAPLALDPKLDQSASAKCAANVATNTWDHNLSDGRTWLSFLPKNIAHVGENLAEDQAPNRQDEFTAAQTMQAWMNSPGHRANILNIEYSKVGFAICHSDNFANFGPSDLIVQHFASE